MPSNPKRLEDLGASEIGTVLTHPWQVHTLDVVTELVERVRGLDGWGDYYEFQRRIVGGLLETETRLSHATQMAKRAARGKTVDPPDTGDWALDQLVFRRISRQLRSVGDAVAWRLFDFDRRLIAALSRNQPAGPMVGKAGLHREVGEVQHLWRTEKRFALLNDSTNCIRVGDVTKFRGDGADLIEIKTNPAKLGRDQIERMERVVATINEGAPMMVDGRCVELLGTSQQLRTHLPELQRGIDVARRDGYSSIRLGAGWVVTTTSMTVEAELTNERAQAMILDLPGSGIDGDDVPLRDPRELVES